MPSETGRANLHTLDEYHEHLLSTSFDANGSFLLDPSSSQIDVGLRFEPFGFDDNMFGPGDNLDMGIGDIGDELARELGEGWGADIPPAALEYVCCSLSRRCPDHGPNFQRYNGSKPTARFQHDGWLRYGDGPGIRLCLRGGVRRCKGQLRVRQEEGKSSIPPISPLST